MRGAHLILISPHLACAEGSSRSREIESIARARTHVRAEHTSAESARRACYHQAAARSSSKLEENGLVWRTALALPPRAPTPFWCICKHYRASSFCKSTTGVSTFGVIATRPTRHRARRCAWMISFLHSLIVILTRACVGSQPAMRNPQVGQYMLFGISMQVLASYTPFGTLERRHNSTFTQHHGVDVNVKPHAPCWLSPLPHAPLLSLISDYKYLS